jgi:hypothetical protein
MRQDDLQMTDLPPFPGATKIVPMSNFWLHYGRIKLGHRCSFSIQKRPNELIPLYLRNPLDPGVGEDIALI